MKNLVKVFSASKSLYEQNRVLFVLAIVLAIIPIITYYYLVFHYTLNIPFFDEFFCSLGWINSFEKASIFNRFNMLFSQANDHRIFSYYFSVAMQYLLNGELDYRQLAIIGNVGMLGLLYVLYKINKLQKGDIFLFLPIATLLFVPIHEISDWSMLTLSGINQYLLVIASLYLLSKPSKRCFISSSFLALMATFSFGSGMFVFFAGFMVLFFSKERSSKKIIIWLIIMLLALILYFTNYHFINGAGSKLAFLNHPFQTFQYFLAFFGRISIALIPNHFYFIPYIGAVVLAISVFLFWKKWKDMDRYSVAFAFLFFIALSAMAAAISRSGGGYFGATAPRYALRSTMFIMVLYLVAIGDIKRPKNIYIYTLLIISTCFFLIRLQYHMVALDIHKNKQINGLMSFYIDPSNTSLQSPSNNICSGLMTNAIKKGFYNPPPLEELDIKTGRIELTGIENAGSEIVMIVDGLVETKGNFHIYGWAFSEDSKIQEPQIGIAFRSDDQNVYFETDLVKRKGVVEHFKGKYSHVNLNCGFDFTYQRFYSQLKPGKHKVAIILYEDDEIIALKDTGKFIEIE